ncbi:MAG TPA: hypothetical protein VIJ51_17365 [Solirubrobacteraceae bacterium]
MTAPATIGGAIDVTDDTHGLDVTDNAVSGSVNVKRDAFSSESLTSLGLCPGCADASEVDGNTINGALICSGNPDGVFMDVLVGANVVHGATIDQCRNESTAK